MKININRKSRSKSKKRLSSILPFFQPKFTINQTNDSCEQKAEVMAEKVMHMPINGQSFFFQKPVSSSGFQRKCTAFEQKEQNIHRKETWLNSTPDITPPDITPAVHNTLQSSGYSLDNMTRSFMESRFGYDFGNVQIHNDSIAHQSSSDIRALAYTRGNHIVFGTGQYQPNTSAGKQLLAHELAHVVQQNNIKNNLINSPSQRIMLKPKTVTAPKVEISKINAPLTPKGINRIIPSKDMEVGVKVKNATSTNPVILSIEGASTENGSATINDSDKYNISADERIKLKGVDQTEPQHAGNLSLIAEQEGKLLKRSNVFSVAAYPSAVSFKFNMFLSASNVHGFPELFWGAAYTLGLDSDSGNPRDCNKTSLSENVEIVSHTGFFKNIIPKTSNFFRSTSRQVDNHAINAANSEELKKGIDAADISKSGFIANQFFRFACQRTGIKEDKEKGPKIPESGFKISQNIGKYFVTTQKEGFANNRVEAGNVDKDSLIKSDV